MNRRTLAQEQRYKILSRIDHWTQAEGDEFQKLDILYPWISPNTEAICEKHSLANDPPDDR